MHKCWFLWGGSAGTFSLFPNSIRSCAAVKLGSEETKEKSIRVSVWPLIFSLLPSFSPHLHHPIFLSLSLHAFSDGPWWPIHPHALHWPGQNIQYPMDSHFRSLPSRLHSTNLPSNPPTQSSLSFSLTSVLEYSVYPFTFLPFLSICCEMFVVHFVLCPFAFLHRCSLFSSKRMRNTYLLAEDHIMSLPPTSICDLHFVWIIRRALFSIIFCHI